MRYVTKKVQLLICGSELLTHVGSIKPPSESIGVTIVLMDRHKSVMKDLSCGEKETVIFESAMAILAQVIEKTDEFRR